MVLWSHRKKTILRGIFTSKLLLLLLLYTKQSINDKKSIFFRRFIYSIRKYVNHNQQSYMCLNIHVKFYFKNYHFWNLAHNRFSVGDRPILGNACAYYAKYMSFFVFTTRGDLRDTALPRVRDRSNLTQLRHFDTTYNI